MPLVWAGGVVTRAKKENRIKDDFALKTLIDELNNFRSGCGGMLNYDWISIPLVYTQVGMCNIYMRSDVPTDTSRYAPLLASPLRHNGS